MRLFLSLETPWLPASKARALTIPSRLNSWVFDVSSLTERLQQVFSGVFHIDVLFYGMVEPTAEESATLVLSGGDSTLIREVLLCVNQVPLVFARSVIPCSSLEGDNQKLKDLGSASLGSLLFSDPGAKRGAFQLAQAKVAGLKQKAAIKSEPSTSVWGRRSCFYLREKPLLVAEFFLPKMLSALSKADNQAVVS